VFAFVSSWWWFVGVYGGGGGGVTMFVCNQMFVSDVGYILLFMFVMFAIKDWAAEDF